MHYMGTMESMEKCINSYTLMLSKIKDYEIYHHLTTRMKGYRILDKNLYRKREFF
jgi:hypothetical protein